MGAVTIEINIVVDAQVDHKTGIKILQLVRNAQQQSTKLAGRVMKVMRCLIEAPLVTQFAYGR